MAAKPSLQGQSPQLHPKLPVQRKRRKFFLRLLAFCPKILMVAWKCSLTHSQGMSSLKYLEDEEGRHCPGIMVTNYSQNNILDKFGRVGETHFNHEGKH